LRRRTHSVSGARALHHMPEAAGSFRAHGPPREEPEGQAQPGRRLLFGWRRGAPLTAGEMLARFIGAADALRPGLRRPLNGRRLCAPFPVCPKRLAASDHADRRCGTRKFSVDAHRAANAVPKALRRQTHGEPLPTPFYFRPAVGAFSLWTEAIPVAPTVHISCSNSVRGKFKAANGSYPKRPFWYAGTGCQDQ
jgi:hypothetical protein